MRIRRDYKPFERSVPTEGSLAFAAQISELLGLRFDRAEIEAQSKTLYETMFMDLTTVLEIDPVTVRFQSGYFHATRAFVLSGRDGAAQINLDTTFDYWTSALSLLAAIATFEVPSATQWEGLARQVDAAFHLFDDATRFAAAREGMMPYLAGYHHLLNLSEGLSRAMLVFTLCHELAHCRLDHLDKPADQSQELEADRLAAYDFLKVIAYGRGNRDTTIHVDPKVAGAPIVFMHLLDLHEAWLLHQGRELNRLGGHPRAAERLAAIAPILTPAQIETAKTVLEGMIAGIADIRAVFTCKTET